MHPGSSLVFLADFFDQAAGYKVLKFFISAQAEHFFTTADGVANFQIGENALEEVVEAEHFFVGKDIAELISDMVWEAS